MNLKQEHKEILEKLDICQIDNLYKLENNQIQLNKLFKVGYVKQQNNRYILESIFDNKHFEIKDFSGLDEGSLVLARVIFNPRGKIKVKIEKLLDETKNSILVYIENKKLKNFKTKGIRNSSDMDLSSYKELDLFLLKNNILEKLGNLNDPLIDDTISLYLYKQEYRADKYEYKLNADQKKIELSKRVDLRDLDFCTIDPKTAKDHDDAIYYEKETNTLYVAIADVSSYVIEGSALDKEAKKRAFSAYFPNKVLPMLPFSLSADMCSLKPNETRYAYVCKIEFDENHVVKKSQFIEAVIESKNNFAYEYIDELIEDGKLEESLDSLLSVTKKLRKRRLKNGYDFRSIEYRLLLDKNEELQDVSIENSSPSHHLVEECMLLANQEAAKKLEGLGIYRVHEEPDIKKIDGLIEKLKIFGLNIKKKQNTHATIIEMQKQASRLGIEAEVDKLIIESQQQARYSSIKQNHFGLGFSNYSHFTSPIRRYSDLVLHRMLKTKKIPNDIDEVCEYISATEREITQMVWDLEERKYARWAKKHIGEMFIAKIVQNEEHPKVDFIDGMKGLRAQILNYHGEQLFSTVKVEILSSDFIDKNIIVKIVSK